MDDYPDLPAGRDDLKTRTYHFVAGPARPWSTPSCALLLTLIVQVHDQHHGAAAGQVQPDLGQLLAVPLTDPAHPLLHFTPTAETFKQAASSFAECRRV